MNREKFHNELAMRLGYECIVKDKRIMISVEDSDDPWVTLTLDENDDIRFKASEKFVEVKSLMNHEMLDEIKRISDAVHHAYMESTRDPFSFYTR